MKKQTLTTLLFLLIIGGVWLWNNYGHTLTDAIVNSGSTQSVATVSAQEVPKYEGEPYVEVNGNKVEYNKPYKETFINLSDLDSLGRCGTAEAVLGKETLPTEKRKSIGMVRPSGWPERVADAKYDFVDGKYLYNRSHLIAHSLSGLNAEEENLITGTRSMNAKYMWQFEEQVLEYIRDTGNHVFYRVTPVFVEDELVARGVEMEAKSLEEEGLEFHVYIFNVEDGVEIDYKTGNSKAV